MSSLYSDCIVIDNADNLTVPFALFVLSSAAFGMKISWTDGDVIPPNHRMSFKNALHESSMHCFTKILVPKWDMWVNEHTRRVNIAFEELEVYILEMISEQRNSEKKEARYDLFNNLLDASVDDPTFTDGDLVNDIPKYSVEDTTLTVGNISGDKVVLPVPRGTGITINTVGLHYNPRYWRNPEEFRPARFLDPDWPREAFIPFSAGPRACIGRKFFETEAVTVISMLISRFKVEIKEEPQYCNETFEKRKARVLDSRVGLTLTPTRVPMVFKHR
ncbi:cytochrome P450 [Lentinula aciculospora]|uniref:Cytochrome P450 n=1 Tax=Lentinula aciculospora TaxID=153920 RepID=A0A9W9A6I4_9AGAR|nr:cytochrome P450 [Lentinula aciculospora]